MKPQDESSDILNYKNTLLSFFDEQNNLFREYDIHFNDVLKYNSKFCKYNKLKLKCDKLAEKIIERYSIDVAMKLHLQTFKEWQKKH
jgi:hypothetical protein